MEEPLIRCADCPGGVLGDPRACKRFEVVEFGWWRVGWWECVVCEGEGEWVAGSEVAGDGEKGEISEEWGGEEGLGEIDRGVCVVGVAEGEVEGEAAILRSSCETVDNKGDDVIQSTGDGEQSSEILLNGDTQKDDKQWLGRWSVSSPKPANEADKMRLRSMIPRSKFSSMRIPSHLPMGGTRNEERRHKRNKSSGDKNEDYKKLFEAASAEPASMIPRSKFMFRRDASVSRPGRGTKSKSKCAEVLGLEDEEVENIARLGVW